VYAGIHGDKNAVIVIDEYVENNFLELVSLMGYNMITLLIFGVNYCFDSYPYSAL